MKKILLLVCFLTITTITTAFANTSFDIDEENEAERDVSFFATYYDNKLATQSETKDEDREGLLSLTTSRIYGNDRQKMTDTKNASSTKSSFIPIEEKLNINCAEGNLEELINYLEKEIKEFDREIVSLTRI